MDKLIKSAPEVMAVMRQIVPKTQSELPFWCLREPIVLLVDLQVQAKVRRSFHGLHNVSSDGNYRTFSLPLGACFLNISFCSFQYSRVCILLVQTPCNLRNLIL